MAIIAINVAVVVFVFFVLRVLINFGFKVVASKLPKAAESINARRRSANLALLLLCLTLCLVILVGNGILLYQGRDIQAFQSSLIQNIPQEYWKTFLTATIKSIILLLLLALSLPLLRKGLDWGVRSIQNLSYLKANDLAFEQSIEPFFEYLKRVVTNGLWLLAIVICASFFEVPANVSRVLYFLLWSYVVIAIGRLLVKAVTAITDTLDELSMQLSRPDNLFRYYEQLHPLIPTFKKCLEYTIYVGVATLIIRDTGLVPGIVSYASIVVQVIGVYFLCSVVVEISNAILEDLVLTTDHLTDLQRQRRLTIIPLFKNILKYVVYFSAVLFILNLLSINPGPLLAGAGLLGLVIGFGAQSLINDIVSGFFILFENHYLVGDYIVIGGGDVEGVVESIEIRTTQIRHLDGQLYIIRNGEVGLITSYSKDYIYARVNVPVPDHLEMDKAYELILRTGEALKAECEDVLEATEIEGVESFDESDLLLRTLTKVKPGKHRDVKRLLRQRLKAAFDQQQALLSSSSVAQ